jgi:hypothetical protein
MIAQSHITAPTEVELEFEFDRQVDALALTGLPGLLEVKDECFRAMLEPLRDLLPRRTARGDGIPFVVVLPDAPVDRLLSTVHTAAGEGCTALLPAELERFRPLPELDIPAAPYLLLDVDPGAESVDLPPADAEHRIVASGRSPLTIAEGLAVLVSDSGVLRSGTSFSLLGSSAGNERVPALWAGDSGPTLKVSERSLAHPGLGAASCGGRRAA